MTGLMSHFFPVLAPIETAILFTVRNALKKNSKIWTRFVLALKYSVVVYRLKKKDKYTETHFYYFYFITTQINSDLCWLLLGRRMQIFCLPKNISLNFLQKLRHPKVCWRNPFRKFLKHSRISVQLWILSSPLSKTPFIDYPLRWHKRFSKIKTDSINSFHIYCSTTQPFKKTS